jgi:hypothetical protein
LIADLIADQGRSKGANGGRRYFEPKQMFFSGL